MHHRLRPLFALALCIPMLAALTGCEADADVITLTGDVHSFWTNDLVESRE